VATGTAEVARSIDHAEWQPVVATRFPGIFRAANKKNRRGKEASPH
jgi:hypothetical protein